MTDAILRILSGIHAGTDIELGERDTWRCGASVDVDILLADSDTPASGFTLERQARGLWRLQSDEATLVFGGVPAQSGPLLLQAGAMFSWGAVSFLVASTASVAPSPRVMNRAQRHVLWQIDKRRYVAALVRAARRPIQVAGGLALLSVAAIGVVAKVQRPAEAQIERQDPWASYVSHAFPSVHVAVDPVSGLATYTGYVDSQVELDHLRSVAAAADKGKTIVRVVPMETLAMHAELYLDDFYAAADVHADGPGGLAITIPGTAAMKKLASWDFVAMERRLRTEIPQIQSVRISLKSKATTSVAVPWSASGYSVMHTPDDVAVATDRSGARLFTGASVKEGALSRVDACTVELSSDGDASLYRFRRPGEGCEGTRAPAKAAAD